MKHVRFFAGMASLPCGLQAVRCNPRRHPRPVCHLAPTHLSHVSQRGQAPATLAAYQGYRMTSDRAQAKNMAPTAGRFCVSGTADTTPKRTLLRPAHCISEVAGEPPTRPTAACKISSADSSWKKPASRGGGIVDGS